MIPQNPFEQIEKALKPYRDMQDRLKPLIEIQNRYEHIIKIHKTFESINRIYASIPKFNNPILEHLKVFGEIGKRLKAFEEQTSDDLLLIAQNGWYIELNSNFNFPSTIASYFQQNKSDLANEKLVDHYKQNIKRIFSELSSRHSSRKEIFTQLLSSFEREEFYTFIPTILSQVDGICFDFTKRKFFIKEKDNNYLPQVLSELEKSVESFLSLYLSPLKNQTPIMAQEKNMSDFPCKLNRHEVLHGIDINYGTEINSLKVLSLIKYISDILIEIDK